MGKCTSKPEKSRREETMMATEKDEEIPEIVSASESNKDLTKPDKILISNALKSHYLFSSIKSTDMELLFGKMKFYTIEASQTIFEQGSIGKKFYIIDSGKAEVLINGIRKVILQKEDSFGEMALLTNSHRRATIKTIEKTTLWGIDRFQFKAALKLIYSENHEKNKNFISNLQIFAGLSDNTKALLTEAVVQHEYQDNYRIICEGDEGLLLFIIKQGSAVAKKNGIEKFRIHEGEMFGETVVFNIEHYRNFSVFAVGKMQCLSIAKENIISILGENFKEIFYKSRAKNSLCSHKLLQMLQNTHISEIVEMMKWQCFAPGEVVFPQINMSKKLFVVCVGAIQSESCYFDKNEIFGIVNENHDATKNFIAESNVVVGVISNKNLEKIIKFKVKSLKRMLKYTKFLSNVEIISGIGLSKLQYLSSKIIFKEYDLREMIFRHFDKASEVFIIKRGFVEIYYDNKLQRILGKFDVFGEHCGEDKLRMTSARASTNVLCVTIKHEDFRDIIDSELQKKLSFRKSVAACFSLNTILMVKNTGISKEKAFYLASFGDPTPIFNVTVIIKNQVTEESQFSFLTQEKTIAISTEHNLLKRMLKYFSDRDFVYLVYEYFPSVPLVSILKFPITEDHARFLSGCILVILEYFDKKDLIYRDLSPENFVMDQSGYLILSHYSCAKITKLRTYTILGNPLYTAPEMALGKGYLKSVDYWSFGIIIYQVLYKKFPFGINSSDLPMEIYDKIIGNALELPKDSVFFKANELICALLQKDPKERIGLEEAKYSKWLSPIDWARITTKKDISPYKPIIPPEKTPKKSALPSLQKTVHVIPNQQTFKDCKSDPYMFKWDAYF